MNQYYQYLTELSRQLLEGCKKTAVDGTVLFTPDGVANYDALWVRDLGYMAEYCGDLFAPGQLEACVEFILSGQREDGWIPDRVEADGCPVYAAGAKGSPVGEANLDNTPFLVFAVYSTLQLAAVETQVLARWVKALARGMDCVPLSPEGLVYNDPARPHSPYGFTDTVCKTGRLFYESLLYWRACRQLAELIRRCGEDEAKAADYEARAQRVTRAIDQLYDPETGLYFAAELDCHQPDVWGAAFLLYSGFPVEEEKGQGLARWLTENQSRYLYKGQASHLPDGAPWQKLLIEVAPGEYQNGAYWATASGWMWYVLRKTDPKGAQQLLEEVTADFKNEGCCECVAPGYRKLPEYVVSAVNVRGPVRKGLMEDGQLTERSDKKERQ